MIGLKFIPLRKPGGETTSHIGVFVKIETKALRHNEASFRGKCPQDLDSSIQKFSLATLPETCQYSESLENMDAIDDNKEETDLDEITLHLPSNNSANGGHALSRGPPRLFRQGGINECTVEVHAESNVQKVDDSDTDDFTFV